MLTESAPFRQGGTDGGISQVALKDRGIDKLVEEAREDNKDNDALYLGRKCECFYGFMWLGTVLTHSLGELLVLWRFDIGKAFGLFVVYWVG